MTCITYWQSKRVIHFIKVMKKSEQKLQNKSHFTFRIRYFPDQNGLLYFLYVKVLLHWMNAGWCDREHRHRYLPDHQQQEAERRHQQHQSLPGQPLHGGPPLPPPLPSHGALARDWHQDLHHGSHLQDAQLPRDSHRARQRQQPHGRELSDVCQFNIDDNPEKIIQNLFSTALEGKGRQTLDSLIFRASKLLITISF